MTDERYKIDIQYVGKQDTKLFDQRLKSIDQSINRVESAIANMQTTQTRGQGGGMGQSFGNAIMFATGTAVGGSLLKASRSNQLRRAIDTKMKSDFSLNFNRDIIRLRPRLRGTGSLIKPAELSPELTPFRTTIPPFRGRMPVAATRQEAARVFGGQQTPADPKTLPPASIIKYQDRIKKFMEDIGQTGDAREFMRKTVHASTRGEKVGVIGGRSPVGVRGTDPFDIDQATGNPIIRQTPKQFIEPKFNLFSAESRKPIEFFNPEDALNKLQNQTRHSETQRKMGY